MKLPGPIKTLLAASAVAAVTAASSLTLAQRLLRAPASGSRQRSRGIIQHASDAIIITDDQQRILQANPAAASMFGATVEAMEGTELSRYIPRDQRLGANSATSHYFGNTGIHLRMKGRRASDYAVTGVKTNGQHMPLEGSLSSLYENGKPIYTIILRDITERNQVQEQLTQSYSQLRELSAALQTIREEERKHIARELHDDLGQLLATLRVDLALLQRRVREEDSRKLLGGMDALLMASITSLRRIASNLRPRALDEGGLYFALGSLRQEFVTRYGIACRLHANEEELILDDVYSTAIYRIVQEALTNITRHADATRVELSLRRIGDTLDIAIQDDGRGIAANDMDKASSYGLIGMRERVWALQGDISIVSDGGTRILVRLPLTPTA
jgi:PAS domain S-box-containing protein